MRGHRIRRNEDKVFDKHGGKVIGWIDLGILDSLEREVDSNATIVLLHTCYYSWSEEYFPL